MNTLLFAIFCIALSVTAQFLLKAGMSSVEIKTVLSEPLGLHSALTVFSSLPVLGGFALYGISAVAWLGVLSQWDVSKAYPLVGLGFVFTVVIGWSIGEQITAVRVVGVALICAGVAVVGRS
jgi:multidrug transporter EmrE-like cation transporter